jgi:DNA-binding response OmpR family regulator
MAEAKILVIDDNSYMRKLLESRLKANNYKVITVGDGKTALEKAQSEMPDLILLDINMPGMDGFEIGTKLRDNVKTISIPIIFVTARGQEEDIFKATNDLDAASYIIKPFKSEILLSEIKKALEQGRL